ncbi:chromate efflux transporter [Martelella soudanensis]|uniref:chromate efflux transporter n=1 Tax=unclassified Martelella TaxID=2629616 RepID=UPI001FEE8FE6|nr:MULTISPECIES: chromate efflux transporter [unclassified Martelella]
MTIGASDGGKPGFGELTAVFARIGLLSFGGPAGQIALMHRIIVDEKRWLPPERYLHALNYCMLLPGPEAQQLATYVGWMLHGVKGGLAAGILFVLPGFILIVALAALYATLGDAAWLEAIFMGLKAAVLAIVVQALWRMAGRSLKGPVSVGLAIAAFVALFVFGVAFPVVVLAAGLFGYVFMRRPVSPEPDIEPDTVVRQGWRRRGLATAATLLVWTAIWLLPLIVLAPLGDFHTLVEIFGFFVKIALFSFGGAYAVLTYVAQEAVATYHWLTPAEMLDGLALAETTPGPLVLVLCFVGFLAAHAAPVFSAPLASGILGAALTAWAIFVPSFLFIFAGAPYVEDLRRNPALSGALSGIGAAIVGVIANLSLWFAINVMFGTVDRIALFSLPPVMNASLIWPHWASLDLASLAISAAGMVALLKFRIGILPLLAAAAIAGLAIGTLL